MKGYEKHEFSAEMAKPAPKDMVVVNTAETPIETPPDERSKLTIEEVLRAERIREREEERPVEPVAASAFTAVSEPDQKLKTEKI